MALQRYIAVLLLAAGFQPVLLQAGESGSLQDAFEINRGMHGKGHRFTWQGREYSTDHPEEIAAGVTATEAAAAALIGAAKAQNAQAAQLGFEWKITAELIRAAEQARQVGRYQQAMNLAAQAKYQARMAIRQAHHAASHWTDGVPE